MNNDIRFLAWIPDEKRLLKVAKFEWDWTCDGPLMFSIVTVRFCEGYMVESKEHHLNDEPDNEHGVQVIQYSNIDDKNGLEIYNEFIIKCSGGIGKVKYADDTGIFEVLTRTGSRGLYGYSKEDAGVEVIGNKFENPELIETWMIQKNDNGLNIVSKLTEEECSTLKMLYEKAQNTPVVITSGSETSRSTEAWNFVHEYLKLLGLHHRYVPEIHSVNYNTGEVIKGYPPEIIGVCCKSLSTEG